MKKHDFSSIPLGSFLSSALVLNIAMFGLFAFNTLADGPAVPAGSMPQAPAATGAATAAPPPGGGASTLVMMLMMFAVAYFLIFRPQQKRMKEAQKMLAALKHGDEVVTSSGLLGKVTGITDKVVTLEIADDVRVKMLKSQVSQIVKGQIQDLA